MQLLPCVLLGDFGTTLLADTITTPQQYRWSTTDNTNFGLSHSRAQMLWDRRSLRIETTTDTGVGDDEDVVYGVADTAVGNNDIMNAFGDDVNDLTWCTNLATWLYHTNDKYDAGDADQFSMFITDNDTDIVCDWTTEFDETDRWKWITATPAHGSFATNGDDIEQWGFRADGDTEAWAAGYFYINSYLAYRSTLSTTSDDYTFSNGIELRSSSHIPTSWNSWRVTGNILGDYPVELARQLHEMETIGISELGVLRRPTPKYQALGDCDNIKTYLMYQTGTLGERLFSKNAAKTVTAAVPVIISNVTTEWVAPSKEAIKFSFDALRFAGV